MSEDCWEARMSARAKARQAAARAEIERKVRDVKGRIPDPSSWLHGWPRLGDSLSVLMGTGVHCLGCGRLTGVTTVAFDDGWEPPGPEPDWPFDQDGCPVCRVVALDS